MYSPQDQEEISGKAYDLELAKRVWRFIAPHRRIFFLSLLLLPVYQAFNLVQPLLMKTAIDAVGEGDGMVLLTTGLFFLAALLGEAFAYFFQYYLAMNVAQRCLADMRVTLFSHVQRLPMGYFDRNPVGRLMTRMTTDVEVLQEMFAAGALNLLSDVMLLLAIVAIMLSLHFELALVCLALVPVLVLAINFFRVKARQTYRLIRARIARVNAYLGEAIPGMSIIQLFVRENKSFQEFDELNAAHRDSIKRANVYEASLFSMVEAAGSLSVALLLWYGGREVLEGIVGIGTFVAFSEYIRRLFIPMRDFSNKYAVIQAAMAAAERIFDLLDTPPTITSPSNPVTVRPFKGEVTFDNVWFGYRPGDPVLKGVSLNIEPGERVAVIGATGSGKTTTIKLMTRFYDVDRGAVRVGGRDVRDWELHALRQHIGVVLQDVFLFSGDILSNLRLGDPSIPESRIVEALRHANAEALVRRLPRGLHAPIRERASNLSAGERQLLALARVFVLEPEILVLDEATSSVDTETELLIQDALEKVMRHRTCLVIAHRLSTIRNADRIVVFHRGVIREMGSHSELLAQRGVYHRLYQLQFEQEEVDGDERRVVSSVDS